MIDDLKIIRKKYGEKMFHFCREAFPTLLEQPGLLSKLLLDNFHESHNLYDDLLEDNKIERFKNYLYSLVDVENDNQIIADKTPEELMSEAGYNLFECYTEEDIQSYKKYYAPGEALCTFKGGRLNTNRVFFAVKKNVDEIRREDFKNPTRQDEYGTSVISIQFEKNGTNTLSIKNRYNHRVNNPDSTFSNNLDNIIPGLTASFEKYKGIVQKYRNNDFEINNYVRANDGKYYKYNYEINNIYYCPDNIIINNFEVEKYDKSRYLIIDYFIIELSSKTILLYDRRLTNSFTDLISQIKSIEIENIDNGKRLIISGDKNKNVEILLDKENNIISLNLRNIKEIGNGFFGDSRKIKECIALQLERMSGYCFYYNWIMERFEAPQLEEMGDYCFYFNKGMREFIGPRLTKMGNGCFSLNEIMERFEAPLLEQMGGGCFKGNESMKEFIGPRLTKMRSNCFSLNKIMERFEAPQLEQMGNGCFEHNKGMREFIGPQLREMGSYCFRYNETMERFEAPQLEEMGDGSFNSNKTMKEYIHSQIEKNNQENGRGRR